MKDYTILIPDMCPIHFDLFQSIFEEYGHKVKILRNEGPSVVHEGLKHVHNDTCYPALLVIGQMIDALKSGKYDLDKVALMMSQTGGGCRASNYIHLLRRSLKKMGLGHIPVLSFDLGSLGRDGGFELTLPMVRKFLVATSYGDMLMLLNNQVRPYEVNKNQSEELVSWWTENLGRQFLDGKGYTGREIRRNLKEIVESFEKIPRLREDKTKVGVVGEIYVKYSPLANNYLEEFLISEDCEVMVPGLMGFIMYSVDNNIEDVNIYGGSQFSKATNTAILKYLSMFEAMVINAVEKYSEFTPPSSFMHLKSLTDGVIDTGCKMGEGWVLTAEMIDLIQNGYENIVCAQPFGCLPNHIVGRGMTRKLKELHPTANIVAIDYDPGATKVNQENRIKLMLAVAKENLELDSSKKKSDSSGGIYKSPCPENYKGKRQLKTET